MSPTARILALLCAGLLLAQVGCKKAIPSPDTPAPAMQNAGPPPTEEEARQFADKMTKAVEARDTGAVDKLIRMGDLADRLVSDLGLSSRERLSFLTGVTGSLQRNGIGQQILTATKAGGSYKLLRIHTVDGRPRALFRMLSDVGVNYHDYILARFPDGEVATEDLFIFLTAEPISQSIRRLVIPLLASAKGSFRGVDAQTVKDLEAIRAMGQAVQTGAHKEAIAKFRALPSKYQDQKSVLVLYMQATVQLETAGEADYLAAMERFRKLYPDDACVDFISIDSYIVKKQYPEARNALDRVDKAVGGDPYMEMLRGNIWMEDGKYDEARAAMEKAIKLEPDLDAAYWARITLGLREKNHTDTLEWLKKIVEQRQMMINDLSNNSAYADFVKSKQHADWLKWYAARQKD